MYKNKVKTSSVDEFASICDGSFFGEKIEPMAAYGPVKYTAAMWMSSVARKNPNIRIITMSPGGTTGTDLVNDLPSLMKFIFKYVGLKLMPLFGIMHELEVGAKRYVDGLNDKSMNYPAASRRGIDRNFLAASCGELDPIFDSRVVCFMLAKNP